MEVEMATHAIPLSAIQDYHAHVYFDDSTVERARRLCESARDLLGVAMGRVHERPVGPHPMWSCQLSFPPERFGEVIPWLALNRDGLILFIHPNTGDEIRDHTDHAIWMGAVRELDLDALHK
jgi:aromatic ring-cleaving dioxygenase